jgi:hypothetical protein
VKDTISPALIEPKLWISSEKTNLATPDSFDLTAEGVFCAPE